MLILNDEIIPIKQKNAYIELLQTPITSIIDINNKDLWSSLLNNHLARYSEENIIKYFRDSESLEPTLITFINSDESQLDFSKVKSNYGDSKAENFFDASIVCNELSNNKYREILTSLSFFYEDFDVDGIADEKLRIIVDESIVPMNLNTLLFMRNHYSNQILYYIKKNINEYVDMITSEVFVLDEVVEILSWDVADDIKTKLLEFTKERLSILNKRYSTSVNAHILKNNLDPNDLPSLFATYEKWNHSIQQIIYSLAIKKIADIITEPKNGSDELLKTLFVSDKLNDSQKFDLFISLLPNLDESMCKEYLDLLGLGGYKKLFEPRSRPRFKANDTNKRLLTAFKDSNLIHDFQEDQEKLGYYKIIRQRPTTESLLTEML